MVLCESIQTGMQQSRCRAEIRDMSSPHRELKNHDARLAAQLPRQHYQNGKKRLAYLH
jgi:hypothetical protein